MRSCDALLPNAQARMRETKNQKIQAINAFVYCEIQKCARPENSRAPHYLKCCYRAWPTRADKRFSLFSRPFPNPDARRVIQNPDSFFGPLAEFISARYRSISI